MTLSRWAIGGYLALVFGSGAVIGALGHRMYTISAVSASRPPSSDEWRKSYIAELKSRLKLRDDQMLQLNIVMDETRSRVREVHERFRPEVEQIRHEHALKVASMLDPDQKLEFDKILKEHEDREKLMRMQQEQQDKEKPAVSPQGTAGYSGHDLL